MLHFGVSQMTLGDHEPPLLVKNLPFRTDRSGDSLLRKTIELDASVEAETSQTYDFAEQSAQFYSVLHPYNSYN